MKNIILVDRLCEHGSMVDCIETTESPLGGGDILEVIGVKMLYCF